MGRSDVAACDEEHVLLAWILHLALQALSRLLEEHLLQVPLMMLEGLFVLHVLDLAVTVGAELVIRLLELHLLHARWGARLWLHG